MLAPKPKSLAEEISQRIGYTFRPDITEFELRRYQYRLEGAQEKRTLSEDEYAALSKVYFNLQQFDKVLTILSEGFHVYKSSEILWHRAICMLLLSQKFPQEYTFDVFKEWFNHPEQPQDEDFYVTFEKPSLVINGQEAKLQIPATGYFTITKDSRCSIAWGPFNVNIHYDDFIEFGFLPVETVLTEIKETIVFGNLTEDEKKFLRDLFGPSFFSMFEKTLKENVHEFTLSGRIDNDIEIKEPILARKIILDGFTYIAIPDIDFLDGDPSEEAIDEEYKHSLRHHIAGYIQAKENLGSKAIIVRENIFKHFVIQ